MTTSPDLKNYDLEKESRMVVVMRWGRKEWGVTV